MRRSCSTLRRANAAAEPRAGSTKTRMKPESDMRVFRPQDSGHEARLPEGLPLLLIEVDRDTLCGQGLESFGELRRGYDPGMPVAEAECATKTVLVEDFGDLLSDPEVRIVVDAVAGTRGRVGLHRPCHQGSIGVDVGDQARFIIRVEREAVPGVLDDVVKAHRAHVDAQAKDLALQLQQSAN